jgi:hypothetical protein
MLAISLLLRTLLSAWRSGPPLLSALSVQQASLLFSVPALSGQLASFLLIGAAFLGTRRFVFTARFAGATDFVFRFDFAPLAARRHYPSSAR